MNPSIGASRYGRRAVLVNGLALALTARARAQTPARLMVLGDSLGAGFGLASNQAFPARLEAALIARGRAVAVLNASVSGDTSAGGLARLDWVLRQTNPTHAIVELGGNDALRGLAPAQMFENLDRILTRLAARAVRVLLAGMVAPPNLGRDYTEEYNAVFPRLARQHGVAFYPFFLDGVAAEARLNQADGIHPNAEGVEEIVRRILPEVERLLAAP